MSLKQRTGGETFRIDRSQIRHNSDGSITVPGYLTRTGVFNYQRNGQTIRELRSDKEVFADEALESMQGIAVTVDHPPDFLTLDNLEAYQVGSVAFVAAQPPYVFGKIRVWSEDAIKRIENGNLKEVSCGYGCQPVSIESEDADVEQTKLDFNHAALGPEGWGRLGRDVALRLDSNDEEIVTPFEAEKDIDMDELNEALSPVLDAIKALEAKHDSLQAAFEKTTEPKETEDSPITRYEDLPDKEKVDRIVDERVDSILSLELQAREAYAEVCGWRRNEKTGEWERDDLYHVDGTRCGKRLCEDVLRTVDPDMTIDEAADLTPYVREAQLLAKSHRQARLSERLTVQKLSEQMTGIPAHMLETPKNGIRFPATFGKKES